MVSTRHSWLCRNIRRGEIDRSPGSCVGVDNDLIDDGRRVGSVGVGESTRLYSWSWSGGG